MCDSKYCRICLVYNVRMHKLSGSEVQEVYEKLSHKKFQEEVLDNACYSCYSQLLKCKQLVTTLQKSKELLKQILINNELNLNSIPFQDRYTHGLVHSLTVTNIESLQIPEYIKITKTENQDESHTNEEMIKDETYDDSALKIEMSDLDEKYNFEQDETIWIPIEKQECVYGFKTNTKANENMLSHTVCEEKSKPVSGALPNEISVLDEKHNFEQYEVNFIPPVKQEYIPVYQTNTTANENILSQRSRLINCDERSGLVPVMNIENCFICNYCGKSCDTKALLVKHIRGHKTVTSKQNNGKYTKNNDLKEDFDIDTGENQFECQYCNYTTSEHRSLRRHIKKHTEEKPFKCQYCNYTTFENYYLMRHSKKHTGEKPFKCQYCNYSCGRSGNLKRHISTHTKEKPLKCQYCNYTTTEKYFLTRHIKTHTGEKPFKCQYCNFACAQSGNLRRHMRIHTNEILLKCQYCNFTSTENRVLRIHIKTHTGEKPFKCQYCNYTCERSNNLKRHIKTHTGEKPVKCQYCNYTCAERGSLKIHIRTHTGEKPLKCHYCSYTCAQSGNLKRHIQTHIGMRKANETSIHQLFKPP